MRSCPVCAPPPPPRASTSPPRVARRARRSPAASRRRRGRPFAGFRSTSARRRPPPRRRAPGRGVNSRGGALPRRARVPRRRDGGVRERPRGGSHRLERHRGRRGGDGIDGSGLESCRRVGARNRAEHAGHALTELFSHAVIPTLVAAISLAVEHETEGGRGDAAESFARGARAGERALRKLRSDEIAPRALPGVIRAAARGRALRGRRRGDARGEYARRYEALARTPRAREKPRHARAVRSRRGLGV